MTFEQCKDQVAKKYGYPDWESVDWYQVDYSLQDSETKAHAQDLLTKEAAILYGDSKAREQMIAVLDWYEKLTPSQKVSVWSKSGEFKGLFDMDSEQLVDRFLQPPYQPK